MWAKALLPLLSCELSSPWHNVLTATDSFPDGFGVCERKLDIDCIADIGRTSERWRFGVEDAIAARQHALEPHTDSHQGTIDESLEESIYVDMTFDGVHPDILKFEDWYVVQGRRWQF